MREQEKESSTDRAGRRKGTDKKSVALFHISIGPIDWVSSEFHFYLQKNLEVRHILLLSVHKVVEWVG